MSSLSFTLSKQVAGHHFNTLLSTAGGMDILFQCHRGRKVLIAEAYAIKVNIHAHRKRVLCH